MSAAKTPQAHVSDKKKAEAKQLIKLLKEYRSVGVVDVQSLPSAQFQKIRSQLGSKAVIRMSKMRVIKVALEAVKNDIQGIDKLAEYMKTPMPALIFTNEDPFRIYKVIQKSKSTAMAKPGQKAPYELIIPAGPTQFPPGPMISELGSMGIKTAIENGKISIKTDKVVAKEGQVIDAKSAALLAKMGIEPMEICLNVLAILDKAVVFTKGVLAVDEKMYVANLQKLHREALALAVHMGFISKDTIQAMIQKAEREANAIASSRNIEHKL